MHPSRILIIDPDVELAENLIQRLVAGGYRALAVGSGQEGLAVVLAEPPDVLLLDVQIQDMDALDALDRLRDHAPRMRVICLIGHGASMTGIEAMEGGAFDFLDKPLDVGLLLEKIAAVVQ